ncbi:MAG: MaoC family dehydratase [Chthoniobacterales bacterium]
MTGLYLEDITVGQRFPSDAYQITEAAIIDFARQFDPQPFHLDRAAAEASVFGGLSASGWHTAAVAMRLFMTGPLQFEGGAIGLGVDELRWPTAVRPNDTIRLETEILETRLSRSKTGYGIVRVSNTARNQNGKVVLSYCANALVRSRKPSELGGG